MEKIVKQGLLYDFYGPLLTKHQQEVYEAFVYDNMSLAEIANEYDISRQGVHDLIKRCDKILTDYESKLKLIERFTRNKKSLMSIKEIISSSESISDKSNLLKIVDDMIEEL